MTSPRAESDLLICWASFNLSPTASDLSTLSLPAKSTRWRQPLRMDPVTNSLPRTWTVKTLQKEGCIHKNITKFAKLIKKFQQLWQCNMEPTNVTLKLAVVLLEAFGLCYSCKINATKRKSLPVRTATSFI